MPNQNNHTAVVIFSRSERQESASKRFLNNTAEEENRKITSHLIGHTLHQVCASAFPYILFNEENQRGENFGEKLSNAIHDTFLQGFENVIVIGNDCPRLNSGHIKQAAKSLQEKINVIGETKKGGVYLIAVSYSTFNRKSFAEIHWQSVDTSKQLLKLEGFDFSNSLPVLDDINSYEDLYNELHHLSSNDSFRILVELILNKRFKFFSKKKFSDTSSSNHYLFAVTAPPVYCHISV